MANALNQQPIRVDTDLVSWKASQTLYASKAAAIGIKPFKITILAVSSTAAGTITITDPNNSQVRYGPVIVPASQAAGTVLYTDEVSIQGLQWRDFAVTGVTATHTEVQIWYRN